VKYRVVIESSARSDIDAAYDWIKKRAPLAAIKWFNQVDYAIRSLARNPHRCVAAPESVEFEQNIRQLVHGRRAGRYRILFIVEADVVHVLHVRHGAQQHLCPKAP
jgi:plasmid stabilization system protein ParE